MITILEGAVHRPIMAPGGLTAVTILILTGSTWEQLQMTPNQMRGTIGKINTNL